MRATLVFPGISACGFGSFGKSADCEASFMPHGLALIAASTQARGHQPDVLDLRRLKGWDEFRCEVRDRSPGVFGISAMSVDYGTAVEAAEIIKRLNRANRVVIGGVHATVATEDVQANPWVDHVISGEGEVTFPDLLDELEDGRNPPRLIAGKPPDLDAIPWAARDLFHYEQGELVHPWLPDLPTPFVSIVAGRGCPFKCTFCQPAERMVFGGKVRLRSVDNVIAELVELRNRYGFRSLLIHDDLFTINPRYVEEFCARYIANGFNQPFVCQARADLICEHEGMVRRMAEAGLRCLMVGFESGSQRILDFVKKGTTVEQNRRAAEICRHYGISIFANYMFGLPTETREDVFGTIRLINWMRPEYPSPAFFTPLPGSYLYQYCHENDLSLIRSYESFRRNPTEPKIKGIDYEFLRYATQRSMQYRLEASAAQLSAVVRRHPENLGARAQLAATSQALAQLARQDIEYGASAYLDPPALAQAASPLGSKDAAIGNQQAPSATYQSAGHVESRADAGDNRQADRVVVCRCATYAYREVYKAVTGCLDALGGIGGLVRSGDRVLVKPNLVGLYPPGRGVTTHPSVVAAIVMQVLEAGGKPLIGDSPGGDPTVFKNYRQLLEMTGMARLGALTGATLVDLTLAGSRIVNHPRGVVLRSVPLTRVLDEVDVVISVPRLKTHTFTLLSAAIKNSFGVVPGLAKAEIHRLAPTPMQFAEALIDVNELVRPHLCVLDAVWSMEGDGPTAGDLVPTHFFAVSTNPAALDYVAAYLVGLEPQAIPTIAASQRRGLCPQEVDVLGVGEHPETISAEVPCLHLPFGAFDNEGYVSGYANLRPAIDEARCLNCGMCARSCPVEAICLGGGRGGPSRIDYKKCIKCLCCHELCPQGAVQLIHLPAQARTESKTKLGLSGQG